VYNTFTAPSGPASYRKRPRLEPDAALWQPRLDEVIIRFMFICFLLFICLCVYAFMRLRYMCLYVFMCLCKCVYVFILYLLCVCSVGLAFAFSDYYGMPELTEQGQYGVLPLLC
jgi:hypothetical protein